MKNISDGRNPLPRSTPEAHGISSKALLGFLDDMEAVADEAHSFMLLRHGHVLAEGWWSPYGPLLPHSLYSLSKSFTSTGAGLAIADGRFSLDAPVVSLFPREAPEPVSANLAAMRVHHLLSMSTGHAEDTLGAMFGRPDGDWVSAFLACPVEHPPGTHFVYNSGATYMVSAIVQRTTGVTLLDYLNPRLFEPLGICKPSWEVCPRGINTGGWGLSVTTEDIARLGQLYLRDGMWDGSRILPEGWVKEATSVHIANGDTPDSDWSQGYGYQFWRSRYGTYRGDGAFGQFCVVLPDQDAVAAITAGTTDMQAELNVLWRSLLPAFQSAPCPVDGAAQSELLRRAADLKLRTPAGRTTSEIAGAVSGVTYLFEANPLRIEAAAFDFREDGCTLRVRIRRRDHEIACGASGEWLRAAADGTERPAQADSPENEARNSLAPAGLERHDWRAVAASGAWSTADTYVVKLCFFETPFCPTITCRFADDRLNLDYRGNVAFGPTEFEPIVGTPSTERRAPT